MINEKSLRKEISTFKQQYVDAHSDEVHSEEFNTFKDNLLPTHFTLYEKACNFCGNLVKIKIDPKKEAEIQESLETCHINTTPGGVTAFSVLFPLAFILVGITLSLVFSLVLGGEGLVFFIISFAVFGIGMIMPLSTLPKMMASNWRMKASNQMVLSVFYIVSYMRHTSNLELAIKFTSDHLAPPLSLDFRRVIWDVETARFSSVRESLEHYLDGWKDYNMEFVESMHLIIASLYESNEKKRLETLEKSMSLILEATYEKMLHFAQNLKSPITMLHMLGVILPILGLVILPLVVSFMGGVQWYHISMLYNVFLPIGVLYLGIVILSTRPTGYGQANLTDLSPDLKKHQMVNIGGLQLHPKYVSLIIIAFVAFLGFLPLILHATSPYWDIILTDDGIMTITDPEGLKQATFSFLGYKDTETGIQGPYGLGSTAISIAVPLSLALGIGFYFAKMTKKLMKIREKTKKLEQEFASALFQLGNRLGDGLPAEIAFGKVAEVTDNTISGKFFALVSTNISTLGMGVEEAIFNKKYGALTKFPSALIESSMKVFVESAKKGPNVAAEALINISTYIKELHRVDERLKDLLAEITSSMQSQINFLAPLISGIVIGLTSMITSILAKLGNQLSGISSGTSDVPAADLIDIFGDGIPTYYFQIVVGLYVIQITIILTKMLNTIQNGYDPLNERNMIGKNVFKSGTLYSLIALVVILLFNIIASLVISNSTFIGS